MVINNRQVNLWRGDNPPPTIYHIWIKGGQMLLNDGTDWIVFLDNKDIIDRVNKLYDATVNGKKISENPELTGFDVETKVNGNFVKGTVSDSIQILDSLLKTQYSGNVITSKIVYAKFRKDFSPLISTIPANLDPIVFIEDSKEIWVNGNYFSIGDSDINIEEQLGTITVNIGNQSIRFITSGSGLSLSKGKDSNTIKIDSSALVSIDTEDPLEWTKSKQLLHKPSGVTEGDYGPTSDSENTNLLKIPEVSVNSTGHIVAAKTHTVQVRDYVGQLPPSDLPEEHNVLLSYNEQNNQKDFAEVRKAKGMTYNDSTQHLTVDGGITAGNGIIVSKGDLEVRNGFIVGKFKGDVEGVAIPKIHSSLSPEYGGASIHMYGHVKVQDELPTEEPTASSNSQDAGDEGVTAIAATPLMVWRAMKQVQETITNTSKITALSPDEAEPFGDRTSKNISAGFDFSSDFQVIDNKIYLHWTEI